MGQPPAGDVPSGTITSPVTFTGLFFGTDFDQYSTSYVVPLMLGALTTWELMSVPGASECRPDLPAWWAIAAAGTAFTNNDATMRVTDEATTGLIFRT
jgi:hypothetical protein